MRYSNNIGHAFATLCKIVLICVLNISFNNTINAQCNPPAALECSNSPVLCSLDELDGYSCQNVDMANPTGPNPLCPGIGGVSHNTSWWGFVGNGDFMQINFEFTAQDCDIKQGIQAGIIDDCGGVSFDCNAGCNTSTITLQGQTLNCHTYYVWVDGCNGDVCHYTISVEGGGPPTIPDLPTPKFIGTPCTCGSLEICVDMDSIECDLKKEWTVNNEYLSEFDDLCCIEYNVPRNCQSIKVCCTFTIGNPKDTTTICHQETKCFTGPVGPGRIHYEKDKHICWEDHQGQGYDWHGEIIYESCINPPCHIHLPDPDGCCADIFVKIELLPQKKIPTIHKFICDIDALPFITEDNRIWRESVCEEEITWKNSSNYNCDTSYILDLTIFNPKVSLSQDCGLCSGKVTLTADINYTLDCDKGDITLQGIWLNEVSDTIGKGHQIIVSKKGKYRFILLVNYTNNNTNTSVKCILEKWSIVVDQILHTEYRLTGPKLECYNFIGDYSIFPKPTNICQLDWEITGGNGTILTPNHQNNSNIQIKWTAIDQINASICVTIKTDCAVNVKTCFETIKGRIPRVDAGPPKNLTCDIQVIKLDGSNSDNGRDFNIEWTGPDINKSNKFDLNPMVSIPGKYTLTITNSVFGCSDHDNVTVTNDFISPKAVINQNGILDCYFNEIKLDGKLSNSNNNNFSFLWETDRGRIIGGKQDSYIVINLPGIYSLIITDNISGCSDTSQIEVNQVENIFTEFVFQKLDISCFDEKDGYILIENIIGGNKPYEFSINGSSFSSNKEFGNLEPGIYNIIMRDRHGCIVDTLINISNAAKIQISAKEDQYVDYQSNLNLDTLWQNLNGTSSIEIGAQIYWLSIENEIINPKLKNLTAPLYTYTVVVIDSNGCEGRDRLNVYVKRGHDIFIPNIFSPSNNRSSNLNNQFLVFSIPGAVKKINNLEVYTRWGEKVYQNDRDIQFNENGVSIEGWDGRLNGHPLPSGVYVYYIELEFNDEIKIGSKTKIYGDIMLMR